MPSVYREELADGLVEVLHLADDHGRVGGHDVQLLAMEVVIPEEQWWVFVEYYITFQIYIIHISIFIFPFGVYFEHTSYSPLIK